VLQKVALLQAVPSLQLDEADDIEAYQRLATTLTPEDTQLFYQIAIVGRRDLELAPDARGGFEMVLLRMIAFSVADPGTTSVRPAGSTSTRATAPAAPKPVATAAPSATPTQARSATLPAANATTAVASDWQAIVSQLNLTGPSSQLAAHCALLGKQGDQVRLALDSEGETFRRPTLEERLAQALSNYYGEPIKLEIVSAGDVPNTPARLQKAAADGRMQAARASIDSDPNIRAMREIFGATIQPDSIRPSEP
jgi:DNA polymerase-3 subunit gamma/tau